MEVATGAAMVVVPLKKKSFKLSMMRYKKCWFLFDMNQLKYSWHNLGMQEDDAK